MAKIANVPKPIAGVKLPKALRRGLKRVAKSQDGKTVLTEALVAPAGASWRCAKQSQAPRHARRWRRMRLFVQPVRSEQSIKLVHYEAMY